MFPGGGRNNNNNNLAGVVRNSARASPRSPLECQVCRDVASSPIYSCDKGGHIVCSFCYDKLSTTKCTFCSSGAAGLHVSSALERLAKALKIKKRCPYVKSGCKREVLSTTVREHVKTCYYRDIACPLRSCQDDVVKVKFQEYFAHLLDAHGQTPLKEGVLSRIPMIPIPVNVDAWRTFHQAVISDNYDHFVLRMNLTHDTFYIWVVMMEDEEVAKYHYATISLFGKQKLPGNKPAASWTVRLIPFHEHPSTERYKTKPVFGSMERTFFVSAVHTTQNGLYKFLVKVEIN